MTSLVRQLEAAVIAAIASATDGAALVRGFRESAIAGTVKTSTGDGRPEIDVAVTPATSDSYASPVIEFSVAVSVRLDWSDDPTITEFDEVAAAVERMLQRWNVRENIEQMSAALSTENFRCDGFRLDGGQDSADIGGDIPAISTTFNFAAKGIFTETTTEDQ